MYILAINISEKKINSDPESVKEGGTQAKQLTNISKQII